VWQYNGTTWADVSPAWDAANITAFSMAVCRTNLCVGTLNPGGAQVWGYKGTTWADVSPPWDAANILAPFMAAYADNLYVGTLNEEGAQVWQLQLATVSVPTMNEWGMIVFMLLAGLWAVRHLKNRKGTEPT